MIKMWKYVFGDYSRWVDVACSESMGWVSIIQTRVEKKTGKRQIRKKKIWVNDYEAYREIKLNIYIQKQKTTMPKAKIKLPTTLTESVWFYEENKEKLKPHLGKPYISYSSITSWESYKEDFIKQKFAKIKLPSGVYAELGNYLGTAVETGKFGENPNGFTGQENFNLIERPEGAEYERLVVLDLGNVLLIGFIDIFHEYEKNTVLIRDLKTGGKGKEKYYSSEDYIQVVLYAHALEQEGYTIGKTDVWFVRRTNSHLNPPLHISDEQFPIDVVYTKERANSALKKVNRVVKEISDCYSTYLKIF